VNRIDAERARIAGVWTDARRAGSAQARVTSGVDGCLEQDAVDRHGRTRGMRRARKTRHPLKLVIALAVLAVVGVAAVLLWRKAGLDWRDLTRTLAGFNWAVVFVLMALLPVAGFSVSVVYLVAGAKFGPVLGGVAVAGATAVHLLATYWICQTVLREPLRRFLKRRGHELPHVPEGENVSVAVMAVLVPGLPYFARNYLLALADVPLRVYFWICLPLYVARSYVTILLGDLGTSPDRKTLLILAAVYVTKLSICAYLIWRIRRRLKQLKAARAANLPAKERSASV
jgi:uncharacterized membrane protein YdjX (TVP38/TMEM64 family)